MVEVPVSLKVSLSMSPRSRLIPFNEASSGKLVELATQVVELTDEVGANGVLQR